MAAANTTTPIVSSSTPLLSTSTPLSTLTSTFTSSILTSSSVSPILSSSAAVTSTFSSTQLVSTTTASSPPPSSTQTFTSTIPAVGPSTSSQSPVVVVVTTTSSTVPASSTQQATTSSSAPAASSSGPASLTGEATNNGASSGLSASSITAIAVVVPVVVVAILVLLGLFLWRRRKQKKAAEEERRKEVEDYGYNPNNDPTIPAVASEGPEMSEDNSGYRGWGAATASNRKASTTLSGGHTQQLSDGGSNINYANSSSPHHSDGNSAAGLMDNRRQTMGSEEFNAINMNHNPPPGTALGGAGMGAAAAGGVKRGPSNASSRYSGGNVSDHSDEPVPQIPQSYEGTGYGFAQHGPYGDGSYGGGAQQSGMPIVRDVSARRNTRIQQGGNYQQGNSGIAQNF